MVYFELCKRDSRMYAKETKNEIYRIRHFLRFKNDKISPSDVVLMNIWRLLLCVCQSLNVWSIRIMARQTLQCLKKRLDSLLYLEISQIRSLLILFAYIVYTKFLWCANFCKFFTIFCLLLTVQQLYCATTSSRLGEKCIPRQIWG